MAIGHTATITKVTGTPVGEFLLIPFGHVAVNRPLAGDSFTFTPEHALSVCKWFTTIGRKLAIDYEHQSISEYNARADKLAPAAGWLGRLEIRGDGLWACSVEWTDRARSLLAAGEYRYFSPVIYWTDGACRDIDSLGAPAITNDPAMQGVQPLVAMQKKGPAMFATVLAARPLPRGVFKLGGGEVDVAQPGGAAAMISAIEDFAESVDWPAFSAAVDEELISAVGAAFEGDDARILKELGKIVESLSQGFTAREIAGGFFIETPGEGDAQAGEAAYRRAAQAGLINLCAATRKALASRPAPSLLVARRTDAQFEREWQRSAQIRNEFGNDKGAFVAFRRAEFAGLVSIAGRSGR